MKNNRMKNIGFVSKRKLAKAIAEVYMRHENTPCPKEQFLRDCEAQSVLNWLCSKFNIDLVAEIHGKESSNAENSM